MCLDGKVLSALNISTLNFLEFSMLRTTLGDRYEVEWLVEGARQGAKPKGASHSQKDKAFPSWLPTAPKTKGTIATSGALDGASVKMPWALEALTWWRGPLVKGPRAPPRAVVPFTTRLSGRGP
uniref:Uncharacterized protein n=1 Tax=Solanum tuberosum TaxID=4113 RepID=M1DAU3_SOLTU